VKRWLPTPAVSMLLVALVFQISVLPDTLDIPVISRATNATALVVYMGLALRAMSRPLQVRTWVMYMLPVGLVFIGITLNILRSLGLGTVGYIGQLLPWSAALAVPFMRSYNSEDAWQAYFRFMYFFSAVALVEYYGVFEGRLSTKLIFTERGEFLQGVVTLFHVLNDGTPHARLYGVFPEPGTYAMWLIPAMAYSWLRQQWPALAVYGVSIFLTGSLGGLIALLLTATVLSLRSIRRVLPRLLLACTIGMTGWAITSPYIQKAYEDKGNSATVRENNVMGFVGALPEQLSAYAFGVPLDKGGSLSDEADRDKRFLGLNFSPYVMLLLGGIVSLLGYIWLLTTVTVAFGKKLMTGVTGESGSACAILTLPAMLLFIVQRQSVFETTLFAFLYAGPLLEWTRGESQYLAFQQRD
jgi:hypothetical protein